MAVTAARRVTPPGSTDSDGRKLPINPGREAKGKSVATSPAPVEAPEPVKVAVEPESIPGFAKRDAEGNLIQDEYVSPPSREINPVLMGTAAPVTGTVELAGSNWERADLKAHPNLLMALATIDAYKRGEESAEAMGVELKALFDSEDFKKPQNKAFYDTALDKLYIGLVDSMKYRVRKQNPQKYKTIVAEIEKHAPKTSQQAIKNNRVYSGSQITKDKRFSGSVDVSWGHVWLQALEKVGGLDLGLLIKNPSFARVDGSINIPIHRDIVINLAAYVGASSIEGFSAKGADGTVAISPQGDELVTTGLGGGKTLEGGIRVGLADRVAAGPRNIGIVFEGKQLIGTDTNIANNGRVSRLGFWYDRKFEIPVGKSEKHVLTVQGPLGRFAVFQNLNKGGRLYPEEPYPGAPEGSDRRIGDVYDKFPWYMSMGYTYYPNGRPDYRESPAFGMWQGMQQVLIIEGFRTQNNEIRRPVTSVMGYRASKGTEGDIPAVREMFNTLGLLHGVSGAREGTGIALIGLGMSEVFRKGNGAHIGVMLGASAARLGVNLAKATNTTDNIKNDMLDTKEDFDTLYRRDTGRIAAFSEGLGIGIGIFDAFAVDPFIKKHPGLYASLGAGMVVGGASLFLLAAPISGGKCEGKNLGRCSFGSTQGFFEDAVPDVLPVYKSWIPLHMALAGGAALVVYPIAKAFPLILEARNNKQSRKAAKSGERPFISFSASPRPRGFEFGVSGRF